MELMSCESLLLKGESNLALQCLETKRSAQLSPQNTFDIYWLELWLQFQLQNRDLNGQQNATNLAESIQLANDWLALENIKSSHKQRLSYLIYLYFIGLETDIVPSTPLAVVKAKSDTNDHFFNAFVILLAFLGGVITSVLIWFYFSRKGILPPSQKEHLALQHHIKERDQELIAQYSRLQDYSFANSHLVRAPLARLMGLVELLRDEPLTKDGKFYLQNIIKSGQELDEWIQKMDNMLDDNEKSEETANQLSELTHFLSIEK